ncbi:MAG: lysostaphin resistance A-like protein [Terracidiphilus sp.]
MEPEIQPPSSETPSAPADATLTHEPVIPTLKVKLLRGLRWTFIGSQGLRAGWSVAIFLILAIIFMISVGSAATAIARHIPHTKTNDFTPTVALIGEVIQFLGLLGAAIIMALIERRRILTYNLTGPRRIPHFLSGMAAGFVALSALVGALAWGHWLHFGPVALSGARIFGYAAIWGVVFLIAGFYEEGAFRCYLQFTLTRGINFWWALGIISLACLLLALMVKGNCVWGVYAAALLGLFPCLMLQVRKAPRSGFWQAAWVTSTFFGLIHITNNGENWIGIFAAAFIGFVFCVSVYVTGSAWWAIGCHAAWDWAESYFYGTADSGMVATGHYLTATPAGKPFWSGGTDGPEGSVLVLGVILLLLAALLLIYGRKKTEMLTAQSLQRAIG